MALQTRIVTVSDVLSDVDKENLELVAEQLRAGQVIALPTETVYGLAANALDDAAVRQIFQVKGRPLDNPLIVHVSCRDEIQALVTRVPSEFYPLIDRFWPGPMTLLFPKAGHIPDSVTAGLDTIAIRIPEHPVARYVIQRCGFPLAMPSANQSGGPSPTRALHVYNDLNGRIQTIVDGGPCKDGLESTVINLLVDPPVVLRPGHVTMEMLRPIVPGIRLYEWAPSVAPACPGLKYMHYSPKAQIVLVKRVAYSCLAGLLERFKTQTIGVLVRSTESELYQAIQKIRNKYSVQVLAWKESSKEIANELFEKLRSLDVLGIQIVFVEPVKEENEGLAIMNRLEKASTIVVE